MLAEVRGLLEAADQRLGVRRTLAPGRASPRPLVELGDVLLAAVPDDGARAVARSLSAVGEALATHFPENVFADLDAVAGALVTEARVSPARANELGERLVALHHLYGRATTIHFRYVHDFLYGFDWARWVAAAPDERRHEPPFGRAFLERSLGRGRELLGLIDANDAKYRKLAPGEARSPFAFRRDPEAEARILVAMADDGSIPVPAWDVAARGRWDLPFAQLREEKAIALGLACGTGD